MPTLPAGAQKAHTDLSDISLAQRIAAADTVALELLMRRHNQLLYRVARSILKNEEEAEETVQDTYLQVFHTIEKYRGDAKLSTWLTRITINKALARARKHKRRAEIAPTYGGEMLATEAQEDSQMQHNAASSPETEAQSADIRRLIERNIDKLPEAFRSVFVLRALEEMTVEETATCLSIPEATVRSRYFRARGQMREALAREIDSNYEEAFGFAGNRCDRIVAGVLDRLAAKIATP
ncbi:RNA polymerase sigma factor [Zhongshania marina]|uniref:RNA polymerase subunit sigma n=1 Tax=Zhongshania marina TaxID=2304603 RepID=A0A2S4HE90_9GAMM|nr:RNA polymerase sigma factor [Marortus luteolus]POP52288.1 RNA polymerase subunit sigma [Marortus luteolus]